MVASLLLVAAVVLVSGTTGELETWPEAVMESDDVTIMCLNGTVSSSTSLNCTHTWRGEVIREVADPSSNITLPLVTIQDAGKYKCTCNDEEDEITLPLKATPRLMSSPIQVIYGDVDRKMTLHASFLTVSEDITFYNWSRGGKPVNMSPGRVPEDIKFEIHGKNVTMDGSRATLSWSLTPTGFGFYDVTLCTRGGCASARFEIKQLGPPFSPRDLTVAGNLTNGVWLSWRSGHTQGGSQLFRISYRKDGSHNSYCKDLRNVSRAGHLNYIALNELTPGTGYYVKVRALSAENESKVSNSTEELYFVVEDSSGLSTGALIAIGLVAGISIASLFLVAVFLKWRQLKVTSGELKQEQNSRRTCAKTYEDTAKDVQIQAHSPVRRVQFSTSDDQHYVDTSSAPPTKLTRPSIPRPPVPGSPAKIATSQSEKKPNPCSTTKKSHMMRKQAPPPEEEVYEAVDPDGVSLDGEYIVPVTPYANL